MSLPRSVQGATYNGFAVTWLQNDGSETPQDLTDATITATIQDAAGNSVAATGTFTITSATDGQFSWAFSAADVAEAGEYQVQFKADYGVGYELTYPEAWTIEPSL